MGAGMWETFLPARQVATILIAVMAMTACATVDEKLERIAASGDDCYTINAVRYWEALDEQHVYVETDVADDRFLIQTITRCPAMISSQRVEFHGETKMVCPGGVSRVAYRRAGLPGYCTINDITRVSALNDARWLLGNGGM